MSDAQTLHPLHHCMLSNSIFGGEFDDLAIVPGLSLSVSSRLSISGPLSIDVAIVWPTISISAIIPGLSLSISSRLSISRPLAVPIATVVWPAISVSAIVPGLSLGVSSRLSISRPLAIVAIVRPGISISVSTIPPWFSLGLSSGLSISRPLAIPIATVVWPPVSVPVPWLGLCFGLWCTVGSCHANGNSY